MVVSDFLFVRFGVLEILVSDNLEIPLELAEKDKAPAHLQASHFLSANR